MPRGNVSGPSSCRNTSDVLPTLARVLARSPRSVSSIAIKSSSKPPSASNRSWEKKRDDSKIPRYMERSKARTLAQ